MHSFHAPFGPAGPGSPAGMEQVLSLQTYQEPVGTGPVVIIGHTEACITHQCITRGCTTNGCATTACTWEPATVDDIEEVHIGH